MVIVFIFLFGLIVGSFLNVVICRLETGEGVVKNRSHCPRCGHVLAWYDLVPVLSFIILRARCRSCAKSISIQYPLVELATGLLFAGAFYSIISQEAGIGDLDVGFGALFFIWNLSFVILAKVAFWFFIISSLIVIFVYDLKHYLISDIIVFSAIILAIVFRFFEIWNFSIGNLLAIVRQPADWQLAIFQPFFNYFLAGMGALIFFLAIVILTRGRGMGAGDIKLAFLMGLLLGWPNILVALLLAFASGAIAGVALILLKRKTMKSQIPFGPFLAAATVLAVFFGENIFSWYLGFF